jgi:hypothetical protein
MTLDPLSPQVLRGKLEVLRFFDASEVDFAVGDYLQTHDLDWDEVTKIAGPICLHLLTYSSNGSFDPHPYGRPSLVHIVTAEDGVTELDLVGWSMAAPHVFATRLCVAGVLGADQLLNPATYACNQPCRLWSTPLQWLQEGCKGVVILNYRLALPLLKKAPGSFASECRAHAAELTRALPSLFAAKGLYVPAARRVA